MPNVSVLPLHLVDQVLLYVPGHPVNLLVLMALIFHGLLENPSGMNTVGLYIIIGKYTAQTVIQVCE